MSQSIDGLKQALTYALSQQNVSEIYNLAGLLLQTEVDEHSRFQITILRAESAAKLGKVISIDYFIILSYFSWMKL